MTIPTLANADETLRQTLSGVCTGDIAPLALSRLAGRDRCR
jgi:hypothetical protein